MWMDDVEMAIDAYRTWLETKIDATLDVLPDLPRGLRKSFTRGECVGYGESLEAFETIFRAGEEDEGQE